MKNSKKLLIVIMSIIVVISTIIPIYADFSAQNNAQSFIQIPDDIGSIVNGVTVSDNTVHKYYMLVEFNSNVYTTQEFRFPLSYYIEYQTTQNNSGYKLGNATSSLIAFNANLYTYYSFLIIPYVQTIPRNDIYRLYIPVYTRNVTINVSNYEFDNITIKFYNSTSDESEIAYEAFQLGYSIGYNEGYADGLPAGAGFVQDLNLVEHCEQLLGTFVGDDYAHYITPLCLTLVVILVYFLFIRWLLALVKSKNVTRVADIIVCTACIIMLVIMYAPMLDLTIHQAQTVYQITADTVVGG